MTGTPSPNTMMALVMIGFPVLTAVALWLFDRNRWFAVLFFAVAVSAFPFFSDSSDWMWFDWIKRYFIIFPCLLVAIAQLLSKRRERMPGWSAGFFAALGFSNVFVFVLEDFFLNHWGNVFFGLALMITFPFRFTYDKKGVVGFKDPFWVIMFCICDAIFIHYCPVIENSYYFVMAILPVEICMLVLMRDWHKAFEFRLYSLGPFLLIDSFIDAVSDFAYPAAFHPSSRIDSVAEYVVGWVAAAFAVAVLLRWSLRLRVSKNWRV